MDIEPYRKYQSNTLRQLDLLVNFVEQHLCLATGTSRSKEARAKAARLWAECARLLNTAGLERTGRAWSKVWTDQKCRVRLKVRLNGISSLSSFEAKTYSILKKVNLMKMERNGTMEVGRRRFQKPVTDPLTRRSFSPEIRENTVYEILEEYEPRSVSSSPTPSPKEQESQEPEKEHDGKCQLEKTNSMLLTIEQIRVEAELKNAQALCSFANSFRQIAGCIDRLSRKYCED